MARAESSLKGVKSRERREGTPITGSAHCLADGGHGTGSKAIPGGAAWLGDRFTLLCKAKEKTSAQASSLGADAIR